MVTMKRKLSIAAAVLLLVGSVGYYLLAGGNTPDGQPRLLTLTSSNFSALKSAFNQHPEAARAVLLISPT